MISAASREMIEVRDVITRFGQQLVHDGVSLSVYSGEVYAVVGGSGSGKSVLLHEIIMLHKPDSGTIELFDQEVTGFTRAEKLDVRRRIGVLFQHGALFSSLTVLENICFPIHEHTKISSALAREIAAFKIDWVGLKPGDAHKYPAQLSGGMQKRAALARALALDPEILFLDEPTSGLDPLSAASFDELILSLRDAIGLTVMMVTHDLDSLWRTTDRVAVLGRGKVLGVGSMKELSQIDDPLIRPYFKGPRARRQLE